MKYLFVVTLLFLAQYVNADSAIHTEEMKCDIGGCKIHCASENGGLVYMGSARSITLKLFQNGVSYYVLKKELGDMATVVVGPKTYLCTVTGQIQK